jgi:hypothetical protein
LPESASDSLIVRTQRRTFTGAAAVNVTLWYDGRFRWLAAAAFFPPLLLVEMLLYRVVAAQRRRISALLGLTACKTPST